MGVSYQSRHLHSRVATTGADRQDQEPGHDSTGTHARPSTEVGVTRCRGCPGDTSGGTVGGLSVTAEFLLGPTGGDFVGQQGDIPEQNNSALPEDRDYPEVSVSSTGAGHGQCSPDGERGDDELPWVEAVAPVLSEQLGLRVDGGDRWED